MTIQFYRADDPYGYLSNFSRHHVYMDGKRWPTSEHYYQAMKFPTDPELQERIRHAKSPGIAKRLAWKKNVPLRPDWRQARDQVMLDVLRAKFTQNIELQEQLLETGEEYLVEHTYRDHYWGDNGDGSGENKLGILLMQVRDEIRDELTQNTE